MCFAEGSLTLHNWSRLATPHLGGVLEERVGVAIRVRFLVTLWRNGNTLPAFMRLAHPWQPRSQDAFLVNPAAPGTFRVNVSLRQQANRLGLL